MDANVVTPEIRLAHQKAFEKAVAKLDKEVQKLCDESRAVAALTPLRNVFEAWTEGDIDGPMPPLMTVESLRSQLSYILVSKREWDAVPSYQERLEDQMKLDATDSNLFEVFEDGVIAIRTALKLASSERALCGAIKLTRTMAYNDVWWADSRAPEHVQLLMKRLSAVWRLILASSLEMQDVTVLSEWLRTVRHDWNVQSWQQLGKKLVFRFDPRSVDCGLGSTRSCFRLQPGSVKRCTREASADEEPRNKKERTDDLNDMQSWLHQYDHQLLHRQGSAVQIRCEVQGSTTYRDIVVTGAYPIRSVGITIAEAFGFGVVGGFDPHQNKGKFPPGMSFTIMRDGKSYPLRMNLKIVQALQEPGDTIFARFESIVFLVSLDAITLKDYTDYAFVTQRPMPRCVGGDASLTPEMLSRLNSTYLFGRTGNVDSMALPLAVRQYVILQMPALLGWDQNLASEDELRKT
eukprot:TRINITY_DN57823_c0_g1_i1.p1 TRINITY_DN57823_c0_g1~~TRINITY_DN57823_c0_g1_i1.p1  ORF type:complete len:463 (-),score=55.89 TRINITY_DN57823_c0_g1_i1:8-1396(-)